MISGQTYTFREEGRRTIDLTLPCFSGSDDGKHSEDFYAAARMNRFYSHTADELYRYASSIPAEGVRRLTFVCRTDTEFTDDGVILVRLNLSIRRLLAKESCPAIQKYLIHSWRSGMLTHKNSRHRI